MIIICYHIKDWESYVKTQSENSVQPIGINVQQISTFVPMDLWVEGSSTKSITKISMYNGTVYYLTHSLDEVDGMLRGICCVHDYRTQHGSHYLISQQYEKPEDFDDFENLV